jgi:hypothetical protein
VTTGGDFWSAAAVRANGSSRSHEEDQMKKTFKVKRKDGTFVPRSG